LYFDRETLRKKNLSASDVTRVAGEAAMTIDGVIGYVSESSSEAPAATKEAYQASRFRGRSADVDIVLEPFALVDGDRGGTTHGTPYTYDTHVPLVFFGAAFRAGIHAERVSPTDIAATLAEALGITPPSLSTGKVLTQALRPARAVAQRVAAPVKGGLTGR
jgi:hypothetical protein